MRKRQRKRRREKRFRPEKLISEREFLTGERKTKEDLPKHLEVLDPKKRKSEPKVNNLTRKHLGSGKKPRWLNSPEKEVIVEDA